MLNIEGGENDYDDKIMVKYVYGGSLTIIISMVVRMFMMHTIKLCWFGKFWYILMIIIDNHGGLLF